MSVSCCPLCRTALSFRRRDEGNAGVDGHWYGCSRCGRELCCACARSRGRRCDRCGGTLEYDRIFPSLIIADRDWRSFLPRFDPELGLRLDTEELIAYASPERVEEIVAAIDPECAEAFWASVLDYEVQRRLGVLDGVDYVGGPSLRFDDGWRASLARLARAGLGGASHLDESAVALRVRLDGAAMLERPAAEALADLDAALEDGRGWLSDAAIRCLVTLAPAPAELEILLARRLASDDPDVRALALRALLSLRAGRWRSVFGARIEEPAFDLLVEELPSLVRDLGVEALLEQAQCRGERGDRIAGLLAELGLGSKLVERVADALDPRHRHFERKVAELIEVLPPRHPARREALRRLIEGRRPRAPLARLAWAFALDNGSCSAELFTTLLERERDRVPALAGLLRMGPRLSAKQRALVRASLDAPGEPGWASSLVCELPDDLRRSWISDEELCRRMTDAALTPDGLTKPIPPLLATSTHYRSELVRRQPRLLLELQLRLARAVDPWQVEGLMAGLGQLRLSAGDGPEALLVGCFEDPSRGSKVRLAAARALRRGPLAAEHRERLLAVLEDPRALIRAWVLCLVADPADHPRDTPVTIEYESRDVAFDPQQEEG